MEELIAALHSLENAVRSLDSFWIAIANLALPLTLSIIVVIQSYRQNKRNTQLQNEQFKKDVILRRYESIFEIYFAFGEVGKYEQRNGIFSAIREGDDYLSTRYAHDLMNRYNALTHKYDLAKLLFGGTDDNLIDALEKLKEKQRTICNLYQDYVVDQMRGICNNAWDKVHRLYDEIPVGDLNLLRGNIDAYNMFLKLTDSKELSQLEKGFQESWDLLSYEKYDVLFTKYLRISEICN